MSDHRYVQSEPKGVVRLCVEGAAEKCSCGATLTTSLDRQLHVCDLVLTTKYVRRGDRQMRSLL